MCITYVVIMVLLISVPFIIEGFFKSQGSSDTLAASVVLGVLMVLFGLVLPFGKTVKETSPATNVRSSNEIFVQSKFPTQTTTSIMFIDKPLQVVKTNYYNAYGWFAVCSDYSIEVVPDSK